MHLPTLILAGAALLLNSVEGKCTHDEHDLVKRLGKTRFYILHSTERGRFTSWEEAETHCSYLGMKMAKIDSVGTDVMIGRHLEALVKELDWKDTWYWIDARYNAEEERYFWTEDEEPIKYSNFLYRQPRPTGVSAHSNWKGVYDRTSNVEICIAISLPWPTNNVYGYQTTWDEKPCVSKKSRHAICEADLVCQEENPNPLLYFTEGSENYIYNGNWIFGDRRYVVNWKPRSYEEAKNYCGKYGLQLYTPRKGDECFLPFAKLWTRRITGYHFWTTLTFDWDEQQFKYSNGTVISPYLKATKFDSRTNKLADTFCVSSMYSFEYENETACSDCSWAMMILAPANCNNPVGTICQHKDAESRTCIWKKEYRADARKREKETALIEFGTFDNSAVQRSTYKQQFRSLYCRKGWEMAKASDTTWHQIPPSAGIKLGSTGVENNGSVAGNVFMYDYDESYWVVDEAAFEKPPGAKCTVSKVVNGQRVNEKVDCLEWHFYICQLNSSSPPPTVPKQPPPPVPSSGPPPPVTSPGELGGKELPGSPWPNRII